MITLTAQNILTQNNLFFTCSSQTPGDRIHKRGVLLGGDRKKRNYQHAQRAFSGGGRSEGAGVGGRYEQTVVLLSRTKGNPVERGGWKVDEGGEGKHLRKREPQVDTAGTPSLDFVFNFYCLEFVTEVSYMYRKYVKRSVQLREFSQSGVSSTYFRKQNMSLENMKLTDRIQT